MPAEGRVRLVRARVAAGLRSVEAAAFGSPRAVPAMAGAGDVMAALAADADPRVSYAVLVPNLLQRQFTVTRPNRRSVDDDHAAP